MSTQKERLDQVEKTIVDVQATIGGLEMTVGDIQKTLVVILARLPEEKEHWSSNGSGSGEKTTRNFVSKTGSGAPVPCMDLPLFDGTDPIAWLAQAEQYFLVHRIPTEEKVQLALIAMTGRSMFWAQWVLRRSTAIPWNQFARELIERFGDSSAINSYEAMHVTRQTGSLEDYLSLFEERIAQLPDLPPEQPLGMFLGGLLPAIRDRIPDSEMTDVFAAIRSARRIARSQKATNVPTRTGFTAGTFTRSVSSYHGPPQNMCGSQQPPNMSGSYVSSYHGSPQNMSGPQQPGHQTQFSSSASSDPRGGRGSRLSPEQQKEYIAKGKCFKCGERYSPSHRCAAKSLMVILEGENGMEDTSDLEQQDNETEIPNHETELQEQLGGCGRYARSIP